MLAIRSVRQTGSALHEVQCFLIDTIVFDHLAITLHRAHEDLLEKVKTHSKRLWASGAPSAGDLVHFIIDGITDEDVDFVSTLSEEIYCIEELSNVVRREDHQDILKVS